MAPTICMIPGWGTTERLWHSVMTFLPEDQPVIHRPWTSTLAELSSLSAPLILVGWSLGAIKALEIALTFPDRVKGLVLVSASLSFCERESIPGTPRRALKAMSQRLYREREETLADFAALCLAKGGEAGLDCTERDEILSMSRSFSVDELAYGMSELARLSLTGLPLPFPGVVLHGRDDKVIPVAAGRIMASQLGFTWREVQRAGHALPFTHPALIAEATEELLAGRLGSPAGECHRDLY